MSEHFFFAGSIFIGNQVTADGGQTIHSLWDVQAGKAKETHIRLLHLGKGNAGREWHYPRPLEDNVEFPVQWPNTSIHTSILCLTRVMKRPGQKDVPPDTTDMVYGWTGCLLVQSVRPSQVSELVYVSWYLLPGWEVKLSGHLSFGTHFRSSISNLLLLTCMLIRTCRCKSECWGWASSPPGWAYLFLLSPHTLWKPHLGLS